jgi:hypothetical protein
VIDPVGLSANPFAALTAVAGPAVLTNACSVLALGTGNRLARVVDRTRVVTRELAGSLAGTPEYESRVRQKARLAVRAHLLLRALRCFYAALGSFATSALLLILAAVLVASHETSAFWVIAAVALIAGGAAVILLAYGCAQMVRETRLAVQNLEEEARL